MSIDKWAELTHDSNANKTELKKDVIATETGENICEDPQETETVTRKPNASADEQNPYNDPGDWSLRYITTDYAHISESTIYLGNNESVTISIEASTSGMNYDDFIIIYDESMLKCEPLSINGNYDGKTLVQYKLWNNAPGK